jgi:hypothetical protein
MKENFAMADSILKLDDETQEVILRDYNYIRKSGLTNMFNVSSVRYIAKNLECTELLDLMKTDEGYASVLFNYSKLMKKFGIKI